MSGLAFSNALIAFWVCWPSVPSPDSANTIVCLPEADLPELDELELLDEPPPQAATPTATTQASAPADARRTPVREGPLRICPPSSEAVRGPPRVGSEIGVVSTTVDPPRK